ncbi:YicC family protein [Candidatus Fermentibacteria bacterium]|nr:YicC family protein [Candidatus Fermentibacteria bacterium]
MQSMTGFGSASALLEGFALRIEARSVNQRGLKIHLRFPSHLVFLEERVQDLARERFHRGRIDVCAVVETPDGSEPLPRVDDRVARAYVRAARKLSERLDLSNDLTVSRLLSLSGVMDRGDPGRVDQDRWAKPAEDCARQCLDDLRACREREGRELSATMNEKLRAIQDMGIPLMEGQKERVEGRLQNLRSRMDALLGDRSLDQDRLYQELALLADKIDVTEEYERLLTHLSAALSLLQSDGEPLGRKLGFLVQEMHRELNTMGAKVADGAASLRIVDMKNELAALRELVANVE